MNTNSVKRTYDTSVRSPWNARIFHMIKAIDAHNELYFKTLDKRHLLQAEQLREYLRALKDWIKEEERSEEHTSELQSH